jgi:hypothetical protein
MFTLDTLHSELRDEKIRKLTERGTEIENPNKIDTLVSVIFRGTLLSEVINLTTNNFNFIYCSITSLVLAIFN